jgi:gamma-glutamyltranspeptidase/glutathione hydrolase
VQVLVNILDFGMDIQEAGDAARFHHTGSTEPNGPVMQDGGELHLESSVSADVVRDLVGMGHHVTMSVGGYGGYQGIWIDHEKGVLIGATESRKDGVALGY